jgi:hypothetical protein
LFGLDKAGGSELYPKREKVQFLTGHDYWFRVMVNIARVRG